MTSHHAEPADIFVIGGGVNGCGIARDAAGRGYSVELAEMHDLAHGTSSGSTKLVHGGLRYLEHYEFRLVRESLMERERLWAMAPHIIWPLRFVLPHHRGLRPRWMLRLGLFIYDHLGGRKLLPPTRTLDLRNDPAGAPLKPEFRTGFEYSDCWVDDTRLVILNARDAANRGARIHPRTRVVSARVEDGIWLIETEHVLSGERRQHRARTLVNAAGPWIDGVLQGVLGHNDARNVRLVQGSHIVVKSQFDHSRCYIFQNADDRIIFAIPYERNFTLIGTTDRDFDGDPSEIRITPEETDYLLDAASEYFSRPLQKTDIVWTYSGVRPLFDDGASKAQEATRDYVLTVEDNAGAALVNIFGGKITTFRRLAEEVLEKIDGLAGRSTTRWTGGSTLPGGDFPPEGAGDLANGLASEFPFIDPVTIARLVRTYGTETRAILSGASNVHDLGIDFGAGLHECEVRYLIEREWAVEADDILWRRTKLGLRFSEEQTAALSRYLSET